MSRARRIVLLAGLVASALTALPGRAWGAPPREVTDEDVDRVMAETKRYLWSQQREDGHWQHYHADLPGGGPTALALFALLEAGESHNDPRMKKGLEALVSLKTTNLYVLATRAMALSQAVQATRNEGYRRQLEDDLRYLTQNAVREGGAWGYGGPERTGDNSCSQFALLALWEVARAPTGAGSPGGADADIRIDPNLIRLVERTWLSRQQADGGWTYAGQPEVRTKSTLTMTTAGLASLFVCQDVLATACRPYEHQSAADAAWKFLADNLKDDYFRNEYLAFCIQRVGMASGRKFVAGMDWFAVAAAELAEPNPRGRSYAGQWGPVVRAAMELIFLARGRIPLTFNKLAHGQEADWEFHTRDVPHFTDYMHRNFERRLRWQVVHVSDDIQRLLDAPILLVTGTKAPDFTPEQWTKLREYTLRGGTLLFVPTHNSEPFLDSARNALAELYAEQRALAAAEAPAGASPGSAPAGTASAPAATSPGPSGSDPAGAPECRYTLVALPDDHPLYNLYQKIPRGSVAAPLWAVSDGTRLLAIVSKRDICCAWQRRAVVTGRLDYLLGVHLFLYATGANPLRMRLRPVFARTPAAGGSEQDLRQGRIAWVRHGGNWCTQPFALEYLSAKLLAENGVRIQTTVGVPLRAESLRGHHLAWMTGSEAFSLNDGELEALRAYLRGGGTLLVNAVGGSRPFNQSAQEMLARIVPDAAPIGVAMTGDSPLVTGKCGEFRGPALGDLARTRAWTQTTRQAGLELRLYHGAGAGVVIHAPYGIHDTLDGHSGWGAMGYMPTAARDIATNIVLYALVEKPQPATSTVPDLPASATRPAR